MPDLPKSANQLDLIYLTLACVGIVIILVCIGTYLFGYGQDLKDRVQRIKALGADMQISVITVFLLVGLGLIVPLVWTTFNDTVNRLSEVESERDNLKKEVELVKSNREKDQSLFLELDSVDKQFPKKDSIRVLYTIYGSEEEKNVDEFTIVQDDPGKKIKVTFKNINDSYRLSRLEVIHVSRNYRWVISDLTPSIPVVTLKKENQ
jgi:hypothetical protein